MDFDATDAPAFGSDHRPNSSVWRLLPNRWDLVAFPLLLGLMGMLAAAYHESSQSITYIAQHPITLSPSALPWYALLTTLRMLAAMLLSLIFTFLYGTLAAKSARAARLLVPMLDILQSVPVLGYISFTVTFFMALFPGRMLGAELASVFAIFTSQAWNMTFSFYQSLRTVPGDLEEVSRNFHLSGWQKFWKLEVPFAMPGLVWNMMMSMSGAWFFVVASEAIVVGSCTMTLPGIGAYLAQAIAQQQLSAVLWVVIAMTLVILAYDQLLFRPLVAWADRFRMENTSSGNAPQSWLLNLVRRTRLIHQLLMPIRAMLAAVARLRFRLDMPWPRRRQPAQDSAAGMCSKLVDTAWNAFLLAMAAWLLYRTVRYVSQSVDGAEAVHVLLLGCITLLRVVVLIALASLLWVPVGVLIGLRPRLAERIQPLAQFLAAFPANLLFPVFVVLIVRLRLHPDVWLSPLMVLGTQWYILFNVIAGASAYPNDFREVASNFHIKGWQWWRQVMLPGIFPYYVTGAITASGGAWNASIVAEVVQWGNTRLHAKGLGAYIAHATSAGDFPRIILGIAIMALFVTLLNHLVWRPMYAFAESRLRLS